MNKDRFPYFSFFILFLLLAFTFLYPLFFSIEPFSLNKEAILNPPSLENIFGTDRLGRDLFSRIIQGGQSSLIVGFLSALIANLLGVIIGVSAGYFQKKFNSIFVIVVDLFLTFPTFFLLLALVSYMQASIFIIIVVISITGWMGTARLIRSESFSISDKPFIKILTIANVSTLKIVFKYFLPLIAPIFLVSFTFGVGGAILAESALSFLGLGIQSPDISWGTILSEGKEVVDIAWWMILFPGLMIFFIIYSLINISDYLQSKFTS
jgi:peptide/nickel transport system permease protein